jgi:endonuclease YncB( thermonuclease family)
MRALALAALLLLAACGAPPGLDRLAMGEEGRVAEVRSGDTLVLGSGLVVRLAGIEAPKGEQPYAAEAQDAMRRLADGRTVQLLYGGARRDAYGRALAHVKLAGGGPWLEQALLKAGAARARTWADNRAMAGELYEAEAYARNRGLGLWKLPAYRVLVPAETAKADGFQVVEGRVRRIGQDEALQFDAGFQAALDPKAAEAFRNAGKSPEQLRGRLVRVRGWMRYGEDGPQIRLDHSEQIELLKEKD